MKILMIGDVFAKPGRLMLKKHLPALIEKHHLEFIVANAENASHGVGVTPDIARDLFEIGIDVLTSGNHIWDKKEIIEFIKQENRLLRPANYPVTAPGKGHIIISGRNSSRVGVINLQGRIFMGPSDDPFRIGMEIVERMRMETQLILVDMHGEASSEKQAMGWFLDGKVTAVCGTHTHVPTADQRILPDGTAYVTDIGMTGPYDSIIGMDKDSILRKFQDQMPTRFEPASENPILQAILINADPQTGKAYSIERVTVRENE
jgi:2',3'-cyclic-nucleotide 2'-phosphodiesterase